MRVANNLPALSAFTSLNSTNKSLQKTINALSTGLRINSASDDAAGFAISEKMRSQIRGLDTAIRNSQDGISLLQTAEGALSQTNSMLQRMRELSLQASNDSLTSNDRQYIQLEIDELKKQIDKIAGTTQFNKKRLLDGSCGALWASSDPNVNVKINGGLTYIDEFGQKVSSEGNYKIEVRAEPGEAQVQKANILKVTKTVNMVYEININSGTDNTQGAKTEGNGWKFENGLLTISAEGTYNIVGTEETTTNRIRVDSGIEADIRLTNVNIDVSDSSAISIMRGAKVNLYLEGNNYLKGRGGVRLSEDATLNIANAGESEGTLQAIADPEHMGAGIGGGNARTGVTGNITIFSGNIVAKGGFGSAGIGSGANAGLMTPLTITTAYNIKIFGGTVTAFGGEEGAGIGGGVDNERDGTITIAGGLVTATGGELAAAIGDGDGNYGYTGTIIKINQGLYNPDNTGKVKAYLHSSSGDADPIGYGNGDLGYADVDLNADITPESPPQVPDRPITYKMNANTLSEISQFYNSNGTFLISQPQTLTITQGDGQTASITLYETDTMYDVAEKINNVIANTFGNAKYTDNPSKFCTISDGTEGTSESVYTREPVYDDDGNITGYNINATMLVRSAIPGKAGELYFSGDNELLNALGLNTIRESSETTYTASIYNAHSGKVMANGIKTTGNILSGIIPNTDIEFASMAGIKSAWDENTKRYVLSGNETYSAYIHLKDNVTTFQTGANKGEDFMIQLGDTSCSAIGISGVNVITRETASHSIGIIDRAINKISSQRAKIGAYQNALEHTMTNLTTTSINLTSAESRIRDADMSKLMMNFVKLQILNQSGTSMLAQANQLPQSILSLLS